jgi:hypothetical protein
MRDRIRLICITGVLALAFQLVAAASASAHHLTVTAQANCEAGAATVNFTVTSWSTLLDGSNNNIQVSFNGSPVFTGQFILATGNVFSGSAPAPPNVTTLTVSAIPVGAWGDGVAGSPNDGNSTTISVPTDCVVGGDGRFTGGGNQVEVAGVAKITRGLTIHCDLLLSNNLEINWDGGNNFHMLEHLNTIACFDNPAIEQKPPRAPLDTLIGHGTGRFNGVDGYDIVFTLIDAGEPGVADQMGFVITAPGGAVVINVPVSDLTGGNLQAHYDQPHSGNGNK